MKKLTALLTALLFRSGIHNIYYGNKWRRYGIISRRTGFHREIRGKSFVRKMFNVLLDQKGRAGIQ